MAKQHQVPHICRRAVCVHRLRLWVLTMILSAVSQPVLVPIFAAEQHQVPHICRRAVCVHRLRLSTSATFLFVVSQPVLVPIFAAEQHQVSHICRRAVCVHRLHLWALAMVLSAVSQPVSVPFFAAKQHQVPHFPVPEQEEVSILSFHSAGIWRLSVQPARPRIVRKHRRSQRRFQYIRPAYRSARLLRFQVRYRCQRKSPVRPAEFLRYLFLLSLFLRYPSRIG